MGVYTWGEYKVEIDEEATRGWYEKAGEWDCTCGRCRNFVLLARERQLPGEILDLLDKLGIPRRRPAMSVSFMIRTKSSIIRSTIVWPVGC